MSDIDARKGILTGAVRHYFEARNHLRRGICLLNAGRFDRAAEEFSAAKRLNPESHRLGEYLVRCHLGRGDVRAAADILEQQAERDGDDIAARVRHALLLWKHGDFAGAIQSLRKSVATSPDCAEYHFQLGTLLASAGAHEEAELRFTQALVIDRRHIDAMVSLAMCYAVAGETQRAFKLLVRAQQLRPHDARIGHLLSVASRGLDLSGVVPRITAAMPDECDGSDEHAIEELTRLICADSEFVDAILDSQPDEIEDEVLHLLLSALNRAIELHGERGDLCRRLGSVLERAGRIEEAVDAVKSCVDIDRDNVPAMIQLARLYQKSKRHVDALETLEEVLARDVAYADVFYLVGESHRARGDAVAAREAYGRAVEINQGYRQAREALETLPA